MAAPTPGGMNKCDPKCKCPSGPYANQAFACDDPCAGQGVGAGCTFDCQNGCDCGQRETGVYQVNVTGVGTDSSVANLNTCYALNLFSYFNSDGDVVGRDIYQSIIPGENIDSFAFSEVQPVTEEEGPVCDDSGACRFWPNIRNRSLGLNEDYCDGADGRRAGTISGSVALYNTKNGEIVSFNLYLGPSIIWGGCDLVVSRINYEIKYIGLGEIADFYENPAYIGVGNQTAIVDCSEIP